MSHLRLASALAALLGVGGALVRAGWGLVGAAVPVAGRLHDPLPGDPEVLVLGAAGAGLVTSGHWLCVVSLVATRDVVARRQRSTGPLRPAWVRATVVRACAPTLGAAVICAGGPVAADPGDHHAHAGPVAAHGTGAGSGPGVVTGQTGLGGLRGLVLPARPLSPPHPARPVTDPVRLVQPGDSLWSIADDELGGTAPTARVSRGWQQLYRANRHRIGPDPDLVLPGTRLRLPPALTHHQHPSR